MLKIPVVLCLNFYIVRDVFNVIFVLCLLEK